MSKQNHDDSIEKMLSEMPKINDSKSFEDYYENIKEELDIDEKPKKRNYKWVLPALTTAAALCIAIIVGYQFLNMNEVADEMSVQNEDSGNANFESSQEESMEGSEKAEGEEESSQFSDQADEAEVMNIHEPRLLSEEQVGADNLHTVSFIIPGPAAQFFVPMTYFLPEEDDPYAFFNEQLDLIQHNGLNTEVVSHIEYVGTNSDSEPIIQVEEDQLQGTASELAFYEYLDYFRSLGHKQVQLQGSEGESLELSHAGAIDHYEFTNKKYVYKLLEVESGTWWARKRLDQNLTLEEALDELKINEEDFSVISPIPPDVEFNINENNQELAIGLEGVDTLITQRMIEGILLTAGTFCYEKVKFEHANVTQVGPYNLEESVTIPDYINVQ